MKKWAAAAIVYLLIVMGSYMFYSEVIAGEQQTTNEHRDSHVAEDKTSEHGHHGEENIAEHESQVEADVVYDGTSIVVKLTDQQGNPVDDLEVNHEKLMHLIIVDEHLAEFYHVHPEKTGKGIFKLNKKMPEGTFKAFVDIKPNNLSYQVKPITLMIGNKGTTHSHQALQPDQSLTRKIEGYEVTLNMSSQKANVPITMSFELNQTRLEPYLGAMGHIVILNEEATDYIHVHPVSDQEPRFETKVEEPGIYKIWAEFKQNGEVRAFPFVVEIKK
ncbi:hypothetical protein WQ54_04080 [Bacillus sp. SA1-12]|uniref:hypothetical protein n=1 Tax=Bacillus sp. SA1-12 TaxID=1455638 RepID=UPI0006255F9B|nr:hypothetical protein [Bacillus sp. SA1-12]KKI93424.1 hypothetical protein WQ54_04080 [Bacillus sp. SA1-12]